MSGWIILAVWVVSCGYPDANECVHTRMMNTFAPFEFEKDCESERRDMAERAAEDKSTRSFVCVNVGDKP